LRGGWDVDDVERNRLKTIKAFSDDDELSLYYNEPLETLLTMCAISGNSKAVALLIQHGANISKGVLHNIVDESVKSPQKTDKLLEVYRTIVDNAVTWKCLEENRKTWTKSSDKYKSCLYETMFSLITEPVKEGEDDVLRHAIICGASEMFQEIVNTEGVFRRSVDESCVWFNITNFLLDTRDTEQTSKPFHRLGSKTPYLHSLLMNYDRWADTDIFNIQPIAKLTGRCTRMTNRLFSIIALVQLIFMIVFSSFYLPSTCVYPDIPNPNSSNASLTKNDCLWNREKAESHSWFPFSILVWTCLLIIINNLPGMHSHVLATRSSSHALKFHVHFLVQSIAHLAFPITVIVWFFDQYDPKNISMVFMFGWFGVLQLLSGKGFSIFTTLLKDVLSIDILPRFLPFFGFTVVAFSFSLHVLRVELLPQEQHYELSLTLYDVFAASFGMGEEMFKNARQETLYTLSLFAVVFMTYMFFTAIILINVLIAMISNRYKVAKRRAESEWRYHALSRWAMFESVCVILSLPVKDMSKYKDIKRETYNGMKGIFLKVDLKRN